MQKKNLLHIFMLKIIKKSSYCARSYLRIRNNHRSNFGADVKLGINLNLHECLTSFVMFCFFKKFLRNSWVILSVKITLSCLCFMIYCSVWFVLFLLASESFLSKK